MTKKPTQYQEDFEFLQDGLTELSGEVRAISTVLGVIIEATNLEKEVCGALRNEVALEKLVPPEDVISDSERKSRMLYLINRGWDNASIAMLNHAPEHLQYPHDCEE